MPVPLILAGASLALKGAAHIKSARENQRVENLNNTRYNQIEAWRNSEMGKDFMDTSVAKSAFTRLKTVQKTQGEAANNAAARSGATTDQALATKSAIQKSTGDTITSIAGMGTQYKSGVEDRYFSRLRDIDNDAMKVQGAKQASLMNFASNAGTLASQSLESDGAVEFLDKLAAKRKQNALGDVTAGTIV